MYEPWVQLYMAIHSIVKYERITAYRKKLLPKSAKVKSFFIICLLFWADKIGNYPSYSSCFVVSQITINKPHSWMFPDSSHSGYSDSRLLHYRRIRVSAYNVSTLSSGFKSFRVHDETKKFWFRIHVLCVNGKTNPGAKRFGFVTSPKTFAPV